MPCSNSFAPLLSFEKGMSTMVTSSNNSLLIIITSTIGLAGCGTLDFFQTKSEGAGTLYSVKSSSGLSMANLTVPGRGSEMSEYLRFAVASSSEILALREAEVAARTEVNLALSKSRPHINASSTVGGYKADVSAEGVAGAASVSLTASKTLFDGGHTEGTISAAELNLELAEAVSRTAINRVSGEAAIASVSLLLASGEVQAVQSFKKELEPHMAQLQLMAKSGLIDRSVLVEMSSRMLEIDIAEEEAKSVLNLAKLDFLNYFGEAEFPTSSFVIPPFINDINLGRINYQEAPILQEARLKVMLADRQLEIARSAFSPKVSATAGSTSPMDPDEKVSAQAGVMLTYQLGDGGAREANVTRAEAKLRQAKLSTEFLIEKTERFFKRQTESKNNIEKMLTLADQKSSVLSDQLSVAEKQIQTGQADVAKIFDIKTQIFKLQSRIRTGRANLEMAKIEIAASLGMFSE